MGAAVWLAQSPCDVIVVWFTSLGVSVGEISLLMGVGITAPASAGVDKLEAAAAVGDPVHKASDAAARILLQ